MIYPKIPLAQSIIQICLAKGITTIIISPGSRNAPLTIGFASNPSFKCYSIADERSAAFFALGIAQQTKQAVALICTSGSALLNYYPAFSEAFYSQIPLIVISADRPQSKIDIGDGQTIRQENVYANHSLYNANLHENESFENDIKINEAINTALTKKGPVHINAPFEEPLYEMVSESSVSPTIVDFENNNSTNSIEDLTEFATIWNNSARKMILVGVNEPNLIDEKIIEAFAKDGSVVVLTETTSNLHHPSFINNIDTIITPFTSDDFEVFQPEILITFGGMGFGVDNLLEMKVKDKKDTTAESFKKVKLIEGFGFTSNYNFLADSFQLGNFNFYARTLLFDKFNISSSFSLDPYATDNQGFRVNKIDIDPTKFKFGSITNGGVSISTSFKSKSKDDVASKKKEIPLDPFMTPDEQQRQLQYVKANPAEFTDFTIPWSLTISYSFQFSRMIKPDYSGFKLQTYSSLNFNGDFSLTPKWKLGGTGYVDVAKASIQQLSMFISREMHCWQLSINVTPIGMYRSFSITVNPKSGILRDLKINRSRTFSSSSY